MAQEIIRIDLKGVNCYLIKTEEGFLLVDTGGHLTMDKEYTDRYAELKAALEKEGCTEGSLKAVILTHGDSDHAANVVKIKNDFHPLIAMHEKDLALVQQPTLDKVMENSRFSSPVNRLVFFLFRKPIRKMMQRVLTDFESFTPDILLGEGEDLSRFGVDARILHLPGHTAGSIGILTAEGELICGDLFANSKVPQPAPNAMDFSQMRHSINSLIGKNIRYIYPGHGDPFEAKRLKAFR
jgi:glyoxylase-like metal-dependent hydrolase (beta-lactamase superfamily II)